MSSSLIPVSFKFYSPHPHRCHSLSDSQSLPLLSPSKASCHSFSKSNICFAVSPSSGGSNYDRSEEALWLREEQRWLREEQRWLREEQRWNAERQSLLRQIQALQLRVEELQRLNAINEASVSETVSNIAKLLQVLKDGELGKNMNRIADIGSIAVPLVVEAAEKEEAEVIKEVIKVSEEEAKDKKKWVALRKGSEGRDVQAMQEDMEYSNFSTGTERAVKTWQATLGASEDGIMTPELLERLYMEQKVAGSSLSMKDNPKENDPTVPGKKSTNGVPIASVAEVSEVQQNVVKEDGMAGIEVSQHRVFLLGENRWEEPSRLGGIEKKYEAKKDKGNATKKCLSCRGEGRLLCMECDGTGEPNIEPQFLEWVDEGAKCPYCEGHGYVTCDVCEGKQVIEA